MNKSDFDFYLPEELIAQTPLEKRDTSRLLHLDKQTGEIEHKHFYDIKQYLHEGDCLVLNDSRVLPARLIGARRMPSSKRRLAAQLSSFCSRISAITAGSA